MSRSHQLVDVDKNSCSRGGDEISGQSEGSMVVPLRFGWGLAGRTSCVGCFLFWWSAVCLCRGLCLWCLLTCESFMALGLTYFFDTSHATTYARTP
eukprot:scaffold30985_cov38-Cyclotella_meneghiniana.AAC.1